MSKWRGRCWHVAAVVVLCAGLVLAAEPKPLLDPAAPRAEQRLKPTWGGEQQVSVTRSQNPPGIVVNVQPGKAQYPGVELKPEGAASWDLSAYDRVEARVVNTGSKRSTFALRVDNKITGQGEPWNTEQMALEPGQAATVTVIFGRSYGQKPGYPLKRDAVASITMFTMKSDVPQSLRIEWLVAAGPGASYMPPPGSQAGPGTPGAAAKTRALLGASGGGVRVALPEGNPNQAAAIKPKGGRWDLHDATEIRVVLKNDGTSAITPRVQVTSEDNGTTGTIAADQALGAGEECEIVVPLAAAGATFRKDAVTSVRIMAERTGAATLLVKSVVATIP